jgi:hypothetical protein
VGESGHLFRRVHRLPKKGSRRPGGKIGWMC